MLGRPIRHLQQLVQQRGRRNAMLAATACAARRAEREDVESYLRALGRPPATPTTARSPGRRVR